MGGVGGPRACSFGPDRDEAPFRAALEGERANAAHLRRVVRRQRAQLHALKRTPVVRRVLALARVTSGPQARARSATAAAQARLRSLALAALAVPTRKRADRDAHELCEQIERLPPATGTARLISVVPVGAGTPPEWILRPTGVRAELSSAAGARGDLVCLVAPDATPLEAGWLARLAGAIHGDVVAATPHLVHPRRRGAYATPHDLRTRARGIDVELDADGAPVAVARGAGRAVHLTDPGTEVAACAGGCILVDRRALTAAGGIDAELPLDGALADLSCRLRAAGGRIVAVSDSVVVDARPVASRRELRHGFDPSGPSWRALVDAHGAALRRAAAAARAHRPSIVVTTAAPNAKVARRWGDWEFGHAFGRALARRGFDVTVATLDRADDLLTRSRDLHLVVRGLEPVRRTRGQRHALWIISHPETVGDEECDEADLVFVASEAFAAELRRRTRTPVEVLLQATDAARFRPVAPQAEHEHPVAVVAKTRDELRPAVAAALAAGVRPAIYGSGWGRFVDPSLVVAEHVPNESLASVYSSVGVLLVDHWDTMRAWGFVSNRVFDALACATPVLSDDVPELKELFGDAVATFRSPEELREQVDTLLADPVAARERATEGMRIVVSSHTFDARADTFLAALDRHGLAEAFAGSPCSGARDA